LVEEEEEEEETEGEWERWEDDRDRSWWWTGETAASMVSISRSMLGSGRVDGRIWSSKQYGIAASAEVLATACRNCAWPIAWMY
jgi:hypothetical protein